MMVGGRRVGVVEAKQEDGRERAHGLALAIHELPELGQHGRVGVRAGLGTKAHDGDGRVSQPAGLVHEFGDLGVGAVGHAAKAQLVQGARGQQEAEGAQVLVEDEGGAIPQEHEGRLPHGQRGVQRVKVEAIGLRRHRCAGS
ncbi:MAG: hypothetical protein ACKOEQ_15545 [Verrucomicrobiota bacterium]